ncbi:metalloenzyme domain-containing protein [Verrucomicrobia bacterium LW23]|nr:metalloenzyme domain-containing protein [Verrucomicrobia bacterium LW23]
MSTPHAFSPPRPLPMRQIVGNHNILFVTLDTLRYDVAHQELKSGNTPHLASFIGGSWEERHSPGSFTYAAHTSFFAGFLPTPSKPQYTKAERLWAARFAGSETSGPHTFVFEAADLVTGLKLTGYNTMCIGGVGFFNRQTALSRQLPFLFDASYWNPTLGVTAQDSAANQFSLAHQLLKASSPRQLQFLFINVSAIHQPNYFYINTLTSSPQPCDTLDSHAAALRYVDSQWPALCAAMDSRPEPWMYVVCSDHGTTYGEDGYFGHRLAHPAVWTVPYAEGIWTSTR